MWHRCPWCNTLVYCKVWQEKKQADYLQDFCWKALWNELVKIGWKHRKACDLRCAVMIYHKTQRNPSRTAWIFLLIFQNRLNRLVFPATIWMKAHENGNAFLPGTALHKVCPEKETAWTMAQRRTSSAGWKLKCTTVNNPNFREIR